MQKFHHLLFALLLLFVEQTFAVVRGSSASAQTDGQLTNLDHRLRYLYDVGRHTEAIPLAETFAALAKDRHGETQFYASAIDWLGSHYNALSRFSDGEPLIRRALAIREHLLSPTHADLAKSFNSLGEFHQRQGHYAEAERLFNNALNILSTSQNRETRTSDQVRFNLAYLYVQQRRVAHIENLYKGALGIPANGRDPPFIASKDIRLGLRNYKTRYAEPRPRLSYEIILSSSISFSACGDGRFFDTLGKFEIAEAEYKRLLEFDARAARDIGLDTPDPGSTSLLMYCLADLYRRLGRYTEAESLYKQSQGFAEVAGTPDDVPAAMTLSGLSLVYLEQNRYQEAESTAERAVEIFKRTIGPTILRVNSMNVLAEVYRRQGRDGDAESLAVTALADAEKFKRPNDASIGPPLNNLALIYDQRGRLAEAESHYKRSLAISGPRDEFTKAAVLNNLALLFLRTGNNSEALSALESSLAITASVLGAEHPDVVATLNNLAALAIARGQWKEALDHLRRVTSIATARFALSTGSLGKVLVGVAPSEAALQTAAFSSLVQAGARLSEVAPGESDTIGRELFVSAQWPQASKAGVALAQTTARMRIASSEIRDLVREREDLATLWRAIDNAVAAIVLQDTHKRRFTRDREARAHLARIQSRILNIDRRLDLEAPEYLKQVNARPKTVQEVQTLVGPDTALVLMFDTSGSDSLPGETYVWVVTATDMRWKRIALSPRALSERVAALRCGLDEEEWVAQSQARRCIELLGLPKQQIDKSKPLPFHLGAAFELYQALFSPFADLIRGKQLLVIPSASLANLPLHVLVTETPPRPFLPTTFKGYRGTAWFGKSHAMTVLPSVSSLRANAMAGATTPGSYIGFGNPVLTGQGRACWSPSVLEKCPTTAQKNPDPQRMRAVDVPKLATIGGRRGRRSAGASEVFKRGANATAVLQEVRSLCPLPETAHEIRCVAERFGAERRATYLGESATEAEIKKLNAERKLEEYRVVHFATHGLIGGDLETIRSQQGEPALVLTPPKTPQDEDDDGLLMASEVAQLKLNADWVVLSACNSAAGHAHGTEALSGLARAFFYAGARALLASHWPVYSNAAVSLTTRTFALLDQSPQAGRAHAFRAAMIELMNDHSRVSNAHPAVWAPFILVGEGDAGILPPKFVAPEGRPNE